ncbi:MAG: BamA/TamA family outer membrane protein [Opitutales bacterium]
MRLLGLTLFVGILLFSPFVCLAEDDTRNRGAAELRVRGYGFFGNRELTRMLNLVLEAEEREYFDATFIEDAALILISRLRQDSYLQPQVHAEVILEDEEQVDFSWDYQFLTQLPRPLQARQVHFQLEPGVLYYYDVLEIDGLEHISEDEAESFFVAPDFLIPQKTNRLYTQERLNRGLANLEEVLRREGFERARAVVSSLDRDDETGAVDVSISVTEGKPSVIASLYEEITIEGERMADEDRMLFPGEPYSRMWVQDYVLERRNQLYRQGYPDARVDVIPVSREEEEDRTLVHLRASVRTGRQVRVGEVIYEGAERTVERVLDRQTRLESGEKLDRLEVEQSRYRLARLGVFDRVEVAFEEVDEETRNVIFRLEEGDQIDISLLFGYGSFELFRGGLEIEQFNILGRAHRSRMLLVQSVKSTRFDYFYSVPNLRGLDITGFGRANFLTRDEIGWRRTEYGGSLGGQRHFVGIDSDVSLRYSYQMLESTDLPEMAEETEGLGRARASFIGLDVHRDRRDNPIYPRAGYNLFLGAEVASAILGGQADYQRFELGSSYHWRIGRGRYINIGLSHGVVNTLGAVEDNLPFNRRFFPGGDTSVRGFQMGEAAPRNEAGELVGSETYTVFNLEFEQMLTRNWSVVAFSDSVGFARRIGDYPVDEVLYSVGVGVRYNTIIGPVRLEYGHNLNPRRNDPSGTIHLSVGFPF